LPFQGAWGYKHKNPGRCPGLCASALSGRAGKKHTRIGILLSGRAGKKHTRIGILLSGRARMIILIPPSALKGQPLLAQGNTLGINGNGPSALKGQKL